MYVVSSMDITVIMLSVKGVSKQVTGVDPVSADLWQLLSLPCSP